MPAIKTLVRQQSEGCSLDVLTLDFAFGQSDCSDVRGSTVPLYNYITTVVHSSQEQGET